MIYAGKVVGGGIASVSSLPRTSRPYSKFETDVNTALAAAGRAGPNQRGATISATKYTASLFGVIVSILLCFV